MATREEAIKITSEFIKNHPYYNNEYIVDAFGILDKEYVWYVPFKRINPILNPLDIPLGSHNALIVDKESDDYFQPGTVLNLTLDDWIYGFRIGLRGKKYDLRIRKINHYNKTIESLLTLRLTYVRIELECGIEWKIPKQFTREEIKKHLEKLPCIFKNQSFVFSINEFREIRNKRLFDYDLLVSNSNPKIFGELIED